MTEVNESKPEEIKVTPENRDERMWAMFCHLSGLVGFVFPFGNIIGPLVIWMIKKEEYPLVNDQASVILIFLVIGIPLLIILGLFSLIVVIIASIKANEGEKYRYPFTIRFLD